MTLMPPQDEAELRQAVELLEQNQFVTRLAGLVGRTAGALASHIPAMARDAAIGLAQGALVRACDVALASTRRSGVGWLDRLSASDGFHKVTVVATGIGGGLLGLPGAAIELPATTTLMLRSIVQIALAEGEDPADPEMRAECLKVFALGGPSGGEDDAESGYWMTRIALAEAIGGFGGRALGDMLPRLIAPVAARFGLPVGLKLSAQALPVVGAAGGAMVNLAFTDHFQSKARGHFIVRRLERAHGRAAVQARYDTLRQEWLATRPR
jgi:hypothetical protein